MSTNGAVRTFTIGTGSLLTWQSQSVSSNSTSGFIKAGSGTWDIGAQANLYTGGFTLNAGTVIVSGNNSFGGSGSLLTINGGTLQSSGTRTFQNPITVGGNFTLAGTGTATYGGAVALGSLSRTITNATTSGGRSFSGVVSGGAGTGNTALTFNGAGAGTIDITGTANTFTGNVTVNGAEATVAADGSLGAVPGTVTANNIVVDGGRFTLIPASGTSFTLNANRGIQVGATAGTSISVKTGTSVTYNGIIADAPSSTGILVKQGGSTFILGGVSTYSGATSINNGTVQLTAGNNRLPVSTVVGLGQAGSSNLGTFDLNGFNQQIAGLSTIAGTATTGTNSVTSATAATLTISGAGSTSFGSASAANPGTITGAISIVKAGTGTQTFGGSAAYTYTGTTTISGGTLQPGNANVLPATTAMILNGGTLSTGASAGFTQSIGTLNLAANSTIALGTGSHTLTFAASNGVTWNGTTLTVTGWTGTVGTSGTAGRVFVGNNATGLTAAQLAKISFNGYPAGATILSTGEVVPVACSTITASINGTSTICTGSSTNLTVTITGGTGPYSLTYSNGTTNTIVSNYTSGANIAVSPAANTTYTLVNVTDANTCAATVSGSAQITVSQPPTTANAGPAQTIFTGQSATLAANAPTSGTGMWSVTSGPSTAASQFSSTSSPTATLTPAGGMGSYVLTWTISNAPCTPSTSNVTITVSNPTVNLSVSSNTGSEADKTAIIVTATAAAPVVGDQTVSLAVTGTGITAGDYTLSSNTITILNGQTAGSVTFTVVDDNVVEGTETATLTISNPSSGIALGNTVAQNITITDNDVAPGLSITDVSKNEGNSGTTTFAFTVSLATPAPAGGVSFTYTTADGTAKAGTDYVTANGTGTIPENSSTLTIDVLVNGNTIYEADKTFYVNISNVMGATVSKGQGIGTILNDDAQPLPDLTIAVSGPASATTGQSYSYSLVVSNGGTADASTVAASFTLPTGVAFATATGTNGFAATQSGSVVSFTGGTLTQGSSATLIASVMPNGTSTVTVSPGAAVVDPNSTITESNKTNNSSTQTVTTTVVAPNQPPVAPTLPNQSGTVAVAFTYTVPTFTDPENGALTYAITGVPARLSANNSTRVISGTPTTTGVSTVTVVATDPQSATTAGTFTITINANQPPVAPTFTNQTATVGTAFSYVVPAFSDAENQPLTYAAAGVPSPLSFDAATRTLSGTPTISGTSTITITATDPANNMTSGIFTLTVNAAPAAGVIRVTEYMYSSNNGAGNGVGEFIELTNVGNAAIDLTGWSFDDNTRTAGSFAIGSLGTVQPNESVIITDATAAQFRQFWFLPASVKVVGGSDQNLGRSDEINIYDAANTLVTRLTYNDQGTNPANTVRTQYISAWPQRNLLGQMNTAGWQLSVAGDAQNSYVATTGDLGNPGGYFVPLNRVKVVESGGTTTVTEGGATDTYTVVLNSQPTADVTVTINAGSQLTVSPAPLTFTPANYSTAQTVTVTAIDDNVYQGAPRSVTITQSVTSSDAAYNGIPANPVSVTIIDNDSPVTAAPTIQVANTTTNYLSLPTSGPGYVSGVISDPTDPPRTLGIDFTLADTDSDINTLTTTAISSNGNATVSLTGSGSTRNLKITPVGVGYATITVTVSDGTNTTNYVVNYAASAASVTTATTRFHTGTSDASTAVVIDANNMLVGDDENQVLRLYNRQNSGLPIAGFDFTSSLGLTDMSGGIPREVDLELSVRQNNRIFWIGSQSNADGGNARVNRDRVFATDVSGSGASTTLSYVGRYDFLREDIINWDVNNGHGKGANYYGLQASAMAGVGSKQTNGYNIEGAEFAPNNSTVYLGFRAPQVAPANRVNALIVPVTNLTSLVSGQAQGSATFGAPIELNLGGRGIREMRKNSSNQYVIIAGPAGDAGASPNDFRLFTWTGNASDAPVERNTNLTSLNAGGSFESIVEVPASLYNNTQLQLLVDNGDAVYYNDGVAAKDLSQNNFKKFRSDIVALGSPLNTAPMATANANQTGTVGTMFTYTVNAFTDAETPNNLTYAAVVNPVNGLSFNPATRTISGTPMMTGVSSVTITGTDPGNLSAMTMFTISVNPASNPTNPTVPFSITSVTMNGCVAVTATERQVTITPNYAGVTGEQISFRVANEIPATTATAPYTLRLYTDNPVISLRATQGSGAEVSYSYDWRSVCNTSTPPANTAPMAVANNNQMGTVGSAFSYVVNTFTDNETPNQLTYAATITPVNGLSFDPATRTISGTPTATGVSSVTIVGTDPGNLSAMTMFTITVNPASTPTNPTVPFSITSVTMNGCVAVSATERQVTITPNYAGLTGEQISFRVANEIPATTASAPYMLRLYTDNPVISLRAIQGSGAEVSYSYDWRSVCNTSTPPANTAPMAVANANQMGTVGTAFSYVVNAFTDAETPNNLTYAAVINPVNGLSFNPATRTISGTPMMTGVSSVTITGTDPGNLSAMTMFTISVNPASNPTNPTVPFSITSVTMNGCVAVSATERQVTITPNYAGVTGEPIRFQVYNETLPTTAPAPYTLRLYTDNPTISLRATQGSGAEVIYSYNWLAVCNTNGRVAATERTEPLTVTVLGNPVVGETVDIEIRGADGQSVRVQAIDGRGHMVSNTQIEQAASVERTTVQLRQSAGIYLLQVSTATQQQTIKLIRD